MLNEHQINFLPERISQRISDINSEYLESIGTVIKKIGELRPKDVHQLQRMYNYGADMEKVIEKLSSVSGKNAQEIYDIFDIVAKENYDYSEPFYKAQGMKFIPYEQNEDLQRYVNSLAKQTVDEYINITQHTAFAVFAKDGKSIAPLFEANKNKLATPLSDTYTKLVDYAVTKVQLGEESYTKAMRDVVKAMVNSGIKTIDYATGYSRNLEASVRQNILWGVKQCNQNTADQIGEDFGADGYEVSYHSNPRPEHADMAGKQFAKGPARTVKGVYYPSFEEVAEPLLNEYGCLHFKFSILLGISVPAHTKEQLEEFKARDKQTFEFEGHKYTAYEGKQLQGRIESAIKYQKDLANTAKKAGDDDLRREAQYNINVLTNKYAKLSEVSGLPTRMERLKMAGFKPTKRATSNIAFNTKPGGSPNATVNMTFINSQKYSDKFKGLTGNTKVDEVIAAKSRAILKNRNGTLFEELFAIDANTGRTLTYIKGKNKQSIQMSKKLEKLLTSSKENSIIIIHNHPNSLTFSTIDVSTMIDYKSISHTIAVAHDSTVFSISGIPQDKKILKEFIARYSEHKKRWSDPTAREKAWWDVSSKWRFSYEER